MKRIRSSTIAMITAVTAIAIGVWDSAQTRQHNRLSVAPYLVVDFTTQVSPEQALFYITLSNEGVGPAVVKSVTINMPPSLGGGTFKEWQPVQELLRTKGVDVPTYWNFEGGEALGVQRSRELFRAIVSSGDQAEALLAELSQIKVSVRYASVYGNEAVAVMD